MLGSERTDLLKRHGPIGDSLTIVICGAALAHKLLNSLGIDHSGQLLAQQQAILNMHLGALAPRRPNHIVMSIRMNEGSDKGGPSGALDKC